MPQPGKPFVIKHKVTANTKQLLNTLGKRNSRGQT